LSGGAGPLREAAVHERVGVLGVLVEGIGKRDGVPGRGFENLVVRLAGTAELHLHEAGGEGVVDLHEVDAQAAGPHSAERFVAEPIVADAAHEGHLPPEGAEVGGHVEGRATQKEAVRQRVPENLADTENFVAHCRKRRRGFGCRE